MVLVAAWTPNTRAAETSPPPVVCDGVYSGHLQGVTTDGESIYWSHTTALVKTDLTGKVTHRVDVRSHHGDLTYHDKKLYVAVEFGQFNQRAGATDSWVFVYNANDLSLTARHRVPELVHGAGGIARGDGRFIVVGGLPGDLRQNFAFEYDDALQFQKRHVLPSGQTRLGIQTAAFFDDHWWFGCYGSPKNPGLLKADRNLQLVGQADADYSYGVVRLDSKYVLRGECFAENRRGKVEFVSGAPSTVKIPGHDLRVAAYNVLFGNWAEPERVGAMFSPYQLDVIAFSEVPSGDWTRRVGRAIGMKYAYVGDISSADHEDKYKSILSRTPLANFRELRISATGWSPASAVVAETIVRGVPVTLLSTHIPGRPYFSDKAQGSAAELLAKSLTSQRSANNLLLLGDLNSLAGDEPLKCLEGVGMRSTWSDLQIDVSRLSTHQHIESGTEAGVIDHIYFRASGAKAVEGGVIYNAFNPPAEDKPMTRYRSEWEQSGKPLSDHRPIWAALEFPVGSTDVATIVALGDSITKGVRPGVTPDQTFAAKLNRQLRAEGHDSTVINLGIGGERTDQALERLDDVIGMRPRLVTVMYGTNDSAIDAGKTESRITLNSYRQNLVEMITRLRAVQIEPVLMTSPRLASDYPNNGIGEHPNKQLRSYVGACREVADEHRVALVDHFADWTESANQGRLLSEWTTDGCHPNRAGHEQLAEKILPKILSLLGGGNGLNENGPNEK